MMAPADARSGQGTPDGWLQPPFLEREVVAFMTTRAGGVSLGPYAGLNLGTAVGDDAAAVARNRAIMAAALDGTQPVYLRQVHGAHVVRLDAADVQRETLHEADAAVTATPGVACVVQVADCLPVLYAAPDGRAVGAAHAGWRGLAAGVLEATLSEVCAIARCAPQAVSVWLGACIGPDRFEVGSDVLEAFARGETAGSAVRACFRPSASAEGNPRWRADLARLARLRLEAAGVGALHSAGLCTVSEPSRFFSYRRDGVTGRMAAAIAIRGR